MSLRIAWFSNGPAPTFGSSGYSSQTALLAPRIKALGHDIAILCSHGRNGGVALWNDIPVYPSGRLPNSQDTLGHYSRRIGADITIAFLDAWVHNPGDWGTGPDGTTGIRFCPLFPVDHDPVPWRVLSVVERFAWQSLCYSRHGYRAACAAALTPRYVPHGFDPAAYFAQDGHPVRYERMQARRRLGLPAEMSLTTRQAPFIVGVVAANNDPHPSRKAWAEIFEGFALFRSAVRADEPDAAVYLYLHTWLDGQVNLDRLAQIFGITDSLVICDQVVQQIGFDDAVMRDTYTAFDVLLAPSHGEGFCLPLLESQACGTPVVTGDWTAMPELVRGGIVIPRTDAVRMMTLYESYQWFVRPQAVCDALVEIRRQTLEDGGNGAERLSAAAQMVHGEYRIDDVVRHYWTPVLAEMETRIRREKTIPNAPAEKVEVVA